jgi:hypothetical protein
VDGTCSCGTITFWEVLSSCTTDGGLSGRAQPHELGSRLVDGMRCWEHSETVSFN